MSKEALSVEDVRAVLVKAVAVEAGIEPAAVEIDKPFAAYGLDSMAALSVGMDIEDSCGLSDLPVDLLWDYPTVDALTGALWALMHSDTALTGTEER
jgi:acyl carrier protein